MMEVDQNDCEACQLERMMGGSASLSQEFQAEVKRCSDEIQEIGRLFARLDSDSVVGKEISSLWQDMGERKSDLSFDSRDQDDATRQTIIKFNKIAGLLKLLSRNELIREPVTIQRSTLASSPSFVNEGAPLKYRTGYCKKAWYIAWPLILFGTAFMCQSVLLHSTTMLYIRYMEKGSDERRHQGGQLFDVVGHYVGLATGERHNGEGAVVEGHMHIPLKLLDASAGLPLVMGVTTFTLSMLSSKPFNIGLWNTSFLVAAIMAILKGFTNVVTIVPDSMGWEACKARLGEDGLDALDNGSLRDLVGFFLELLAAEFYGGHNGKRIRYCADMMISGHTYFTVIFSQVAYRNVEYMTSGKDNQRLWKWVRRALIIICFFCVFGEIGFVAMARFHYTVDMLLSVILVGLLFDSIHIRQIAADWSEGFSWQDPSFVSESSLQRLLRNCGTSLKEDVVASQGYMLNLRRVASYQRLGNAKYPESEAME